jgi:hypothetical protein
LIIIAIVGHHQVSSWRDFMKTGKKVRIYTDFAEPRRETVSTIFFKQAIKPGVKLCFLLICLQGKKGEIRPPKLKTEDPNKSYVQRPVKRG